MIGTGLSRTVPKRARCTSSSVNDSQLMAVIVQHKVYPKWQDSNDISLESWGHVICECTTCNRHSNENSLVRTMQHSHNYGSHQDTLSLAHTPCPRLNGWSAKAIHGGRGRIDKNLCRLLWQ